MKKIAVDLSYINSEKKFYESVFVYAKRILNNWDINKQQQISLIIHKNVKNRLFEEFPNFKFIIYNDSKLLTKIPYFRGIYRFFKWKSFINSLNLDVIYLPFCWSGNSGKTKCRKVSAILDLRPMRDLVRLGTSSFIFKSLKLKNIYYRISRYFYTKHIKNSHLIITISNYVKNDILKEWKDLSLQIKTVYCGIPIVSQFCQPHGINNEDKYILYVNSLAKYKNVLTLIKAYNEIIKSNEFHDIKLVIVGRETEYWRHEVIPFINKSGIENRIINLNYVTDEELGWLYSNAMVFVTTSLHEGFGLTPVEAIMYGCPVISSMCESLPEVTKSKYTMYYNPPLDYLNLSNIIRNSILSNTKLRLEFNILASQFKAKYDVKVLADKVYSILDEL